MTTHSSVLAWRIPWTEEPGGLQCTGLQSTDPEHARTLYRWGKNRRTSSSASLCGMHLVWCCSCVLTCSVWVFICASCGYHEDRDVRWWQAAWSEDTWHFLGGFSLRGGWAKLSPVPSSAPGPLKAQMWCVSTKCWAFPLHSLHSSVPGEGRRGAFIIPGVFIVSGDTCSSTKKKNHRKWPSGEWWSGGDHCGAECRAHLESLPAAWLTVLGWGWGPYHYRLCCQNWTSCCCRIWRLVTTLWLEGDLLCHEAVWFQEVMVYWSVGIGTLATWHQEPTHWKRAWPWERLKATGERETQRMRWLGGITDSMDMTLSHSGRLWRTGKPGVLQPSTVLQRVRRDLATERQQEWVFTVGKELEIKELLQLGDWIHS